MNPDAQAVATPDRRATAVAESVLARGGTAADAVIAASAMLCVVYPQNVTLGGDSWTLVAGPDDPPIALNGTGRAPAAASAASLRAQGWRTVPATGPLSITVPGLVASWGELHDRWGRLPFEELITPARDVAADGFVIAAAPARDLAQHRTALSQDRGCAAALLRPDGSAPREGDLWRLPQLADTLERLAVNGPRELYQGDVARRYAAGLAAAGSMISVEDLADHHTATATPLVRSVQGLDIITSPPNSQGFTWLLIVALMERLGVDDLADPDQVAVAAAAVDVAGRVRDQQLADRSAMITEPSELLDRVEELAADLRRGTDLSGAAPTGPGDGVDQGVDQAGLPRPYLGGDTIGMVVKDASGCWVSSVQSVAGTFGSRVLEPSTGILAHNRGSGFSLDPAHPGYLVGGRRPPHTLMPALIRRADRVVGALAAMGGHSQPMILAQVLNRILRGASAQDAVGAPRWVVQRADGPGRTILVDRELPAATTAALRDAGSVGMIDHQDNRLGHCQAIWQTSRGLSAGADPRADG